MTSASFAEKRPRGVSSQRFLTTFAVVFALIAAFLMLDFSLARIDRRENTQHAANLFHDGRALLKAGHPAEAANLLANAVALDRNNTAYGLALAQAMAASRRYSDAERLLSALLDRSPNDAAVNLTMARLLSTTGRLNDAKVFYHRAIFGRWASDSTRQRMNARFELIDVLARQNSREELLAELLPLESLAADSTMLLKKVSPLYIQAGSAKRAIDVYRELLKRVPGDAAAYAGLGEAYLALGQFRDAQQYLLKAIRIDPADSVTARRLSAINTAMSLDPNARGISDAERARRSRAVLQRTLAFVDWCSPRPLSTQLAQLRDSAIARLATNRVRAVSGSTLEAQLALSRSIWSVMPQNCKPQPNADAEGLDLVQQLLLR